MTAMVLLTANSLHKLNHGDLSLDRHLVEIGLQTINQMAKETESEMLQSFHATCTELHQRTQQRCAEAAIMANNVDYSSRYVHTQHRVEENSHDDDF
jgi:hypothetical protein